MSSKTPLDSQYLQAHLRRGVDYLKKEEWDNAITDLSKAIKLNPRDANTYNNRGAAYFRKKEWDNAIDDFSKAIELDPRHADAYLNRGLAYNEKEEWDKSIVDSSKVTELNPQDADAYVSRGLAYLKKKEWDNAITDLSKATERNPQDAEAYLFRGLAYNEKGEWDKAIADFNKATELNPQDTDAYVSRGRAYFGKKEGDNAIDDFSKAIELNPQDAEAYLSRGYAYNEEGEWNKAIDDLSDSITHLKEAIEPNPRKQELAHLQRGTVYLQKGEWDKAICDFDAAIEIHPQGGNPELALRNAHFGRGLGYYSKGEWDRAIADFSKAIELDPQHADAYFSRERAYLKKRESGQSSEISVINQALSDLLKIAQSIRHKLFYGLGKPAVAHYTSLDTLKNLVSIEKGGFRLYNSIYMNDPKEGRVFFEMVNARMKGEEGAEYNLEKRFYGTSYRSPAYIGSFTPVESEEKKEKLLLWLAYGKQGKEEAAGSCLIFPRGQFAENQHSQVGPTSMTMTNKNLEGGDDRLSIYEIVYIDEIPENLRDDLDKLAQCLQKVGDRIENQNDKDAKDKSQKQVREALDSIRFLFKTSHYEGEREVRVLQLHYPKEKSDKIKVDAERIPPRFYLEAPEDFCFSEVILGPRMQHFGNWKWWERWITEQRPQTKVKESDIPYSN